jgi:hypothetical protein
MTKVQLIPRTVMQVNRNKPPKPLEGASTCRLAPIFGIGSLHKGDDLDGLEHKRDAQVACADYTPERCGGRRDLEGGMGGCDPLDVMPKLSII